MPKTANSEVVTTAAATSPPLIEAIEPPEIEPPAVRATVPPPRRGGSPSRALVAAMAGVLTVVLGGMAALALRGAPASTGAPTPSAQQQFATPAPGHVTVSLVAKEDSHVRVTVDGTVQFDGLMRPGEHQNWDGKSGIDVWTDNGKTLGLVVDGRDLGPYSPAMNHPDWNRIDYSFWPGWSQSLGR